MSISNARVRIVALAVLFEVLMKKNKAKAAIEHATSSQSWDPRDIGLLREMVYGVLRNYFALEADFSRFVKQKPSDYSRLALLLGTYQLRLMRIPDHAAVGETVAAIKPYETHTAGFINAVLRQVAKSEAPKKLKPHQRAELPQWMYALWRDAFSAEVVSDIAAACNNSPDLCLAVFTDREAWMQQAQALGLEVKAGSFSSYAVLLDASTSVTTLPGFAEGELMVMDQAAQMATLSVDLKEEDGLLLDLCAAPGGKTALLSHRFPKASITAVELNPRRIPRLEENLKRLQCSNTQVLQADCAFLPYADNSVDAIMLDAPCSASGTLRRHPDAKFLHNIEDVKAAGQLQLTLLKEALRVLKPGASMTYAVCSIHTAENEEVIAQVSNIISQQRLLPNNEHDGFFFATITK